MRLDRPRSGGIVNCPPFRMQTMGDCGAFSYVKERVPPVSTTEVVDFYENCGFDYGISVDHVIMGYEIKAGTVLPGFANTSIEWRERQAITLELADEFLKETRARGVSFTPLGVAQGWSPESYSRSVSELQKIGYQKIALGGMVPLRTSAIFECLETIGRTKNPTTEFHLLGISRCAHIPRFRKYGVTSVDSTSPLKQAFKENKNNYYTLERNFSAIRVPQAEGNPKLQARIRSGELRQEHTRQLEQRCLWGLREFDRGGISVEDTLEFLLEYEQVHRPGQNREKIYREVLTERPWTKCQCDICRAIGIEVIVFRGSERNKRRGFHNLSVLFNILQAELESGTNVC